MSEIVQAVVSALAAGAALSTDKSNKAIRDSYRSLKEVIGGRLSSLSNLEEDPEDEDYQRATAKEILKKQLFADTAFLRETNTLVEMVRAAPAKRLLNAGINISKIRAHANVIIANLRGSTEITDVEAKTGDVRISGVIAEHSRKN